MTMPMIIKRLFLPLLCAMVFLSGCALNPVTGQRELAFVSEAQELQIGASQYTPGRQMQGGDYLADPRIGEYVSEVGKRLAFVSDRMLPYEFTVINDSTPNAWALPGGKIAINRGLLVELRNEAELAAVLAHEIVHAAARHGAKGMERGLMLQGAVLATGVATAGEDYATLAVGGAQLAAGLINQKYGRDAELQADYYGMQYMARAGYDPQAAVSLQETFVRLSEGRSHNWLAGLFASHPPSRQRVEANRDTALELAADGELGQHRYEKNIARLLQTKAAYAALDQGQKALGQGKAAEALALADQALTIEPQEALFYALRGEALQAQDQPLQALASFDRALQLNDGFFRLHLLRGQARRQAGDTAGATTDLEQSLKLLPTAAALNTLGQLALESGDRQKAKKYFATAAKSSSKDGQQAGEALVRLDLPDNPDKYLKARLLRDRRGYLIAEVANPTPLAVKNILLKIRYPSPQGRAKTLTRKLSGPIGAGKKARGSLGIGPIKDAEMLKKVRLSITAAALAE